MSTAVAPSRLNRWDYAGYGLGSVGTGIFSTIPGLLLLTFMIRHLAVPAAIAGLVILVPRLWDVITDPLAGSLSDRTRTRIGARRPWLLAGAVTMPIAFALIFQVPTLRGTQAALYVLGVYILGTTSFTVFQVPYVAMPAEMTDDYHERTTIMAWRIAFLTIGILLAGGAAPEIVAAGGGGRDGYALMGLVLGGILFAVLIGAFLGTRRTRIVEPTVSTAPFREQLRAAAENRPFFWLLGAFIVQALGVGAMLAGVDFFAAYILEDPSQTAILFVFLIAPALFTMPFWSWVGHRFGKKAGFVACVVIFALGGLSLVTASPDRLWLVYLQVFVMGTAYAGTQMFPFAMLPDTITVDTARTGLRRAGAFTGVWTAGEKLGFAAGPALFAAVLAFTGFIETEGGVIVDQPAAALVGVSLGFAVAPALLMLLSLLLVRRYTLDEEAVRGLLAPPPDPAPVPAPTKSPA